MFHAVIMLIATCFGCTLYYFYAFSGTNLLTRCHSASSVFSAIFRFRNPRQEISSESDEIFSYINKRPGSFRSLEGTWGGGAPRAPRHRRVRPKVGPRRAMAWWPQVPQTRISILRHFRRKLDENARVRKSLKISESSFNINKKLAISAISGRFRGL